MLKLVNHEPHLCLWMLVSPLLVPQHLQLSEVRSLPPHCGEGSPFKPTQPGVGPLPLSPGQIQHQLVSCS